MRRGCEARWPIEARKTLPPKGPRPSALPPSTAPPIFLASIAPSTSPTAGSLTLNFSLDFALSLSFPSFPSPFLFSPSVSPFFPVPPPPRSPCPSFSPSPSLPPTLPSSLPLCPLSPSFPHVSPAPSISLLFIPHYPPSLPPSAAHHPFTRRLWVTGRDSEPRSATPTSPTVTPASPNVTPTSPTVTPTSPTVPRRRAQTVQGSRKRKPTTPAPPPPPRRRPPGPSEAPSLRGSLSDADTGRAEPARSGRWMMACLWGPRPWAVCRPNGTRQEELESVGR